MYGEHGYEQDYKKALEWCQKASDLNISSGHTLLAEIYFFGYGVDQDLQKSALIYEKAALQDHPHAQLMVFQIYNVYLADQSTIDQKATGLVLLKRAVNANYPKAMEVHNHIYGQKI
jgi:TPR repeat protein